MANEAVKVELTNSTGNPRRFTCASGTTIAKGTLLKLTDPRTASANGASEVGSYLAGIASMEKSDTDTSTAISVWTDGIFEMVASGSITAGYPVKSSNGNIIEAAAESIMGSAILGYALEDATNAETINVRVSL